MPEGCPDPRTKLGLLYRNEVEKVERPIVPEMKGDAIEYRCRAVGQDLNSKPSKP